MDYVGVARPKCVASDGKSIYFMAYEPRASTVFIPYDASGPTADWNTLGKRIFLVRSNPYPSSITDVRWSIVSTFPKDENHNSAYHTGSSSDDASSATSTSSYPPASLTDAAAFSSSTSPPSYCPSSIPSTTDSVPQSSTASSSYLSLSSDNNKGQKDDNTGNTTDDDSTPEAHVALTLDDLDALSGSFSDGSMNCYMDDQGVFTWVSRTIVTENGIMPEAKGLRYVPGKHFNDQGVWYRVDFVGLKTDTHNANSFSINTSVNNGGKFLQSFDDHNGDKKKKGGKVEVPTTTFPTPLPTSAPEKPKDTANTTLYEWTREEAANALFGYQPQVDDGVQNPTSQLGVHIVAAMDKTDNNDDSFGVDHHNKKGLNVAVFNGLDFVQKPDPYFLDADMYGSARTIAYNKGNLYYVGSTSRLAVIPVDEMAEINGVPLYEGPTKVRVYDMTNLAADCVDPRQTRLYSTAVNSKLYILCAGIKSTLFQIYTFDGTGVQGPYRLPSIYNNPISSFIGIQGSGNDRDPIFLFISSLDNMYGVNITPRGLAFQELDYKINVTHYTSNATDPFGQTPFDNSDQYKTRGGTIFGAITGSLMFAMVGWCLIYFFCIRKRRRRDLKRAFKRLKNQEMTEPYRDDDTGGGTFSRWNILRAGHHQAHSTDAMTAPSAPTLDDILSNASGMTNLGNNTNSTIPPSQQRTLRPELVGLSTEELIRRDEHQIAMQRRELMQHPIPASMALHFNSLAVNNTATAPPMQDGNDMRNLLVSRSIAVTTPGVGRPPGVRGGMPTPQARVVGTKSGSNTPAVMTPNNGTTLGGNNSNVEDLMSFPFPAASAPPMPHHQENASAPPFQMMTTITPPVRSSIRFWNSTKEGLLPMMRRRGDGNERGQDQEGSVPLLMNGSRNNYTPEDEAAIAAQYEDQKLRQERQRRIQPPRRQNGRADGEGHNPFDDENGDGDGDEVDELGRMRGPSCGQQQGQDMIHQHHHDMRMSMYSLGDLAPPPPYLQSPTASMLIEPSAPPMDDLLNMEDEDAEQDETEDEEEEQEERRRRRSDDNELDVQDCDASEPEEFDEEHY